MNEPNEHDVWLKTTEDKLKALLADEAKQSGILNELLNTTKQLKAKNSFRIALINQLLEERNK